MDKYKVLSIKPGYAMQIARRRKIIEFRKWATEYRGPLLIHSSGKKDRCGIEYNGAPIKIIPGHIIAVANLNRVAWVEPEGCFYWYLSGAQFIKPIPEKGKLWLWEYKEPIELITSPEEYEKYIEPLLI